MLIHATVTITGGAAERGTCEARLRRLLSTQNLKNEVAEHHGDEALCYDLKVEGGIPFPAFARASQEFPRLRFRVEWVDVGERKRGAATIVNGRVTEHRIEPLPVAAGGARGVCVRVAADGALELALALFHARGEEWRGYALTATRDALLRVRHAAGSDAVELLATEGAPEWSVAWRGFPGPGVFVREALRPAIAIDEAEFRELEGLARGFAQEWIWFASDPQEEIAAEAEHCRRLGRPVREANVRAARLEAMPGTAGAPSEHCTIKAEDAWVRDLVLATWAKPDNP